MAVEVKTKETSEIETEQLATGCEAIAEEGRRLLGFAAGAAGHNIRISSLN